MTSEEDLMKFKVAELKTKLVSLGLDTKGTKPTLVARLKEALDEQNGSNGDITNSKKAETPLKRGRLTSGSERPETPTRKSRRLSESMNEGRPDTPTRKSRRLSGQNLVDDRPESPIRNRIEAADNIINERPSTPSRKSRRLSGAGVGDAKTEDCEMSIDDQLGNLASHSRRVSGSARKKRTSQLGGNSITTIPEMPEKELSNSDHLLKESLETDVKSEKSQIGGLDNSPDNEILTVISPSEQNEDKEVSEDPKTGKDNVAEELNVGDFNSAKVEKDVKNINEVPNGSYTDKENMPVSKVLDQIIVPKHIPRQKPKSGKFWKGERKQFRSIKKDRGQRFTFEQRLKMKEDKLKNKELAQLLLSQKAMKKEEARKRAEENKANKLENQKKSEQYQVIKNPAKIKRMKKKQLRMLEKRDIISK